MIRYYAPLALFFLLLGFSDAQAQRIPTRSRRPTFSPYINLFNNNNQGGVSNYFSFVRPLQNQARLNQLQMMENRFLQQQLGGGMPMQFGQNPYGVNPFGANAAIGTAGMLRPGMQGAGQPSVAASYFNYSHFYNVPVNMQQSLGFGAGGRAR